MEGNHKYSAKRKLQALKLWEKNGYTEVYADIVCEKYKCSRASLYKWKKEYNGNIESLENKSSKPKSPHPNSSTQEELYNIEKGLAENPTCSYLNIWGKLKEAFNYTRHFLTFFKHAKRLNPKSKVESTKELSQQYDTPIMIGAKWQMDVKFVPKVCYIGETHYEYDEQNKKHQRKFYQWTILDEASRRAFAYVYDRHDADSTIDFLTRAVEYFGYYPEIIQTDNGKEFTNRYTPRAKDKNKHIATEKMKGYGITHKLIKPGTPKHNGKVERLHRKFQETFYNHIKFINLADLNSQLAKWLEEYNNTPHKAILDQYGKQKYQTPLQKQTELLTLLKQQEQGKTIEITAFHNREAKLSTQVVKLNKIRWTSKSKERNMISLAT